jgi:hypothetical protein
VTGSCENGNEPLGSMTGGGFLEKLSDYRLLRKDCYVELNVRRKPTVHKKHSEHSDRLKLPYHT